MTQTMIKPACCPCGMILCPFCEKCHSIHCEVPGMYAVFGIDCAEAFTELGTLQRAWDRVVSYTGRYARLRHPYQDGLITEDEYELIGDGKTV